MTKYRVLALVAGSAVVMGMAATLLAAPASQPSKLRGPASQPSKPVSPAPGATPATPFLMPNTMTPLSNQVEAELRVWHPIYQIGQPVWVEFALRNLTDAPVALQVPNALVGEAGPPAMGLPLAHVFSGADFGALLITRESDQGGGVPVVRKPVGPVAPLLLAPFASIGVHVDASKWYPMLRQAGEYRLQWKPYNGLLTSNTVFVKVATFKDAVIRTDAGPMRVRLFYDKAPKTVESFLQLVQKNFYDGMTFHRLLPGFVMQGGSPTGDDTGVRPDGVRLKAEFNNTPFERGTLAMARAEDDPDSASCQFFVCLGQRLPELDGRYTAFGQLIGNDSFETLAKLENTEVARGPHGEMSLPSKVLRIQAIILENAHRAPSKIHPLGGPSSGPGVALKTP